MERGRDWPAIIYLLRYLPGYLRCSTLAEYGTAALTYIVFYVYQMIQEPPYYHFCVMVVVTTSLLIRIFVSHETMVVSCVVGTFVPLVVLKPLGWIMGSEWKGRSVIRAGASALPSSR